MFADLVLAPAAKPCAVTPNKKTRIKQTELNDHWRSIGKSIRLLHLFNMILLTMVWRLRLPSEKTLEDSASFKKSQPFDIIPQRLQIGICQCHFLEIAFPLHFLRPSQPAPGLLQITQLAFIAGQIVRDHADFRELFGD